jgi:ELWxxDGT repeat protein
MTAFNNEVLFNGVDANGLSGLWVTDGTVGSTHELVAGAGGASDPAGLNPTSITDYNGEVLFSGLDASGDMGLWVSDGTAAGTHELTVIVGADTAGLAPSDLTVYNGEVLFRGLDQSGRAQLWITNGTVAGTQELTGIVGAATTGAGHDSSGLAVFDGMALFSGVDSSGNIESGRHRPTTTRHSRGRSRLARSRCTCASQSMRGGSIRVQLRRPRPLASRGPWIRSASYSHAFRTPSCWSRTPSRQVVECGGSGRGSRGPGSVALTSKRLGAKAA